MPVSVAAGRGGHVVEVQPQRCGDLGAGGGVGDAAAAGQQGGQRAGLDRAALTGPARHPGRRGRRSPGPARRARRRRRAPRPAARRRGRRRRAARSASTAGPPQRAVGQRAQRLRLGAGQRGQHGGLQLLRGAGGERREVEDRQLARCARCGAAAGRRSATPPPARSRRAARRAPSSRCCVGDRAAAGAGAGDARARGTPAPRPSARGRGSRCRWCPARRGRTWRRRRRPRRSAGRRAARRRRRRHGRRAGPRPPRPSASGQEAGCSSPSAPRTSGVVSRSLAVT